MKDYKLRVIVALASSLLSLAAQGQGVCYCLTQVGTGAEDNFFISDMNNKGEVVGGKDFSAFLWRNGQFVDLPPPLNAQFSEADGINDHSDIVGGYLDAQFQSHAVFLRNDGKVFEVPALPGGRAPALIDINNRRAILGGSFVDASGLQEHFIWQRGRPVTLLERLPEDQVRLAAAINVRGAAAGSGGQTGSPFAELWQRDGSVTRLSSPEGAAAAIAFDINDRGQVLADAFFPSATATRTRRAFIWEQGVTTVLGLPYSDQDTGAGSAMNNRGLVVGTTFNSRSSVIVGIATLWRRGRALDLNTLICADDPLRPHVRLDNAREVNDRGDIVAEGIDTREPDVGRSYFLAPSQ